MVPLSGSPSLAASEPDDLKHWAEEGDNVFFYVEVLTHPAAQFQWRRVFTNGSHVDLPSVDTDTSSNLTLNSVSMDDFGFYTVSASNIIGHWPDVEFELRSLSE